LIFLRKNIHNIVKDLPNAADKKNGQPLPSAIVCVCETVFLSGALCPCAAFPNPRRFNASWRNTLVLKAHTASMLAVQEKDSCVGHG
jgi:hypothetical protein